MIHCSVFTGIGCADYVAECLGWTNLFQVENDPKCIDKLEKNFKEVKRYEDIRKFNGRPYANRVNVLSGGFPCQDLSVANSTGKKGFEGSKSGLYYELIRVICEILPDNVVIENVYGLVTQDNGKALEAMLSDMAILGYSSIPLVIYSSACGANHHRKRVFTYATRLGDGVQTYKIQTRRHKPINLPGWSTEPGVPRVYDGPPNRLDKSRNKALGNGIVTQVIEDIFKSIESVYEPVIKTI